MKNITDEIDISILETIGPEEEKDGWYIIPAETDELTIKIKNDRMRELNSDRIYYPKNYHMFLTHTEIPIRIYEDGSIFYDDNDIGSIPRFINIIKSQSKLKKFIDSLE